MFYSTVKLYIRTIIAVVPLEHWVVLSLLLSTVIIVFHNKYSWHGAISLGIAVWIGSFLLDTAVLIRLGDIIKHDSLDIDAEMNRVIHGGKQRWIEMFGNLVAFIPYGFCLSVFISEAIKCSHRFQIGFSTLLALVLSMCIESLQLLFHVGYFELTDLALNSLGAFGGSCVAAALTARN